MLGGFNLRNQNHISMVNLRQLHSLIQKGVDHYANIFTHNTLIFLVETCCHLVWTRSFIRTHLKKSLVNLYLGEFLVQHSIHLICHFPIHSLEDNLHIQRFQAFEDITKVVQENLFYLISWFTPIPLFFLNTRNLLFLLLLEATLWKSLVFLSPFLTTLFSSLLL